MDVSLKKKVLKCSSSVGSSTAAKTVRHGRGKTVDQDRIVMPVCIEGMCIEKKQMLSDTTVNKIWSLICHKAGRCEF